MQGRKPKPTHLKLLQGNAGHRPLRADAFSPPVVIPPAPKHVRNNKEALAEWKRVTKELALYGLIAEVDRAALAFYVVNWARHMEAEDMIAKAAAASGGSGLFVKAPSGYPIQSPWLAVSNKSMELCCKFLIEFGMSPSSRTRVTASDPRANAPAGITGVAGFNSL